MLTHKDAANLAVACEKEPIHIPGAIQPFGALFSVDEPRLIIQNASANCCDAFGMEAADMVGRSFAEFVDSAQLDELKLYLDRESLREQSPLDVILHAPNGTSAQAWELSAHRHQGSLILELERCSDIGIDLQSFHRNIRDAVQAIQATGSLQQLCEAAVQQVQTITGFDRVMLYQFTEEWHGRVIAEVRAPHMDAYLGHYFPASDIPAQARAVFLENWLRMIPDVDYAPAVVYPGTNPKNGAPLDLGHSTLRSVSPIHIEYLRNMHVKATLTVSLVNEGKLWGLIACHHATPRLIPNDSRLGAKMVGQLVSSQIQLKQSLDDLHYRARLRTVHAQLLSFMEKEEDLAQGLVRYNPNMLELARASGAAAAIYHDNEWTCIGKTPSSSEIEQLVEWLVESHGGESMFCTDRLSKHFSPAHRYKEIASGLLAISIPKTGRNYILWFRPQVATTVTWAGNPQKTVQTKNSHLSLHPRTSFQSWQEIVEGVAEAWRKVEIEAIVELRNSILALDLQREFQKEQQARARAERISMEKEHMVHMVSHDLRTPLNVVRMTFEMLQLSGDGQAQAAQGWLGRGLRATEAIERLANDVLNMAKVDAGTLVLEPRAEDADSLVRDVVETMAPLAEQKDVRLRLDLDATKVKVLCERPRIEQVLNNLIGNALKFTPAGGSVTVSVEADRARVVFCVADTGIGIPDKHQESIFERFWQEHHAREQGTGLGLSIAKRIVEEHGSEIWVESKPGIGSKFYFSLNRAST
jgi:light-regulated signal transduction histidine kinase (bacteriophytochrome)